jgi:hypothetical protein
MNTKLIIVDGHCSTGKSSISKSVFKQLDRQLDAYWLHEECQEHPIREGEFSFGALDTSEGMELNRTGMLQKWTSFRNSILAGGKVCVTEGCLLHAYDRYFIHSCWNDEQIAGYYDQVIDIIKELNPVIVLLHRPDLRSSLEEAFLARGDWWRNLMLKRDDLHVYFKDHVYVDENSMFDAIAFEQAKMKQFFEGLTCTKIMLDTTAADWETYTRQIITKAGGEYKHTQPFMYDPGQFTGTYRLVGGGDDDGWSISYDEITKCLYSTIFWPFMPMRCISESVFELVSFPVEMRFKGDGNTTRFSVHGNYDWEYNEREFIREQNPEGSE